MEMIINMKLSRAVNYGEDYISPGGFEIELEDGTTKRFDFTESAHYRYAPDMTSVRIEMKHLDKSYEDGDNLTLDDIKHIKRWIEFFVGIDDHGDPMDITEIKNITFIGKHKYDNIVEYKIPVNILKSANEALVMDHNI